MYKRYISLFCVLLLVLSLFSGCTKQENNDDTAEEAAGILTESKIFINGYDQDPNSDIPLEVAGFDSPQSALEYFEKDDHIPTWDVLWLVVKNIDTDATDAQGNVVHRTLSLAENDEKFFMEDMPLEFENSVNKMTNGELILEVHPSIYKEPVTFLDGNNSISVNNFDLETREWFKEYDSVIITFRPDADGETQPVAVETPGSDYGIQDSKYGFCVVPVTSSLMYQKSEFNQYPASPWIHEWIHTIRPLSGAFGIEIPSPDSAADYGYTVEAKTQALLEAQAQAQAQAQDVQTPDTAVPAVTPESVLFDFYKDILSGNVPDVASANGKKLVITPAMWKAFAYTLDTVKS